MVLSDIHFLSSSVMRMPESQLVFCEPCFGIHIVPRKKVWVSLKQLSFAQNTLLKEASYHPHAVKCNLPMARKKNHYHSLRIEQHFFFSFSWEELLEIHSFPGAEKQFKRTITLCHIAKSCNAGISEGWLVQSDDCTWPLTPLIKVIFHQPG